MASENLRKDQRVAAKIAVVFKRGRATWSLTTSDVSFRGLFVLTETPPPLRSLVQMRVTLPEGRTFETHAMVVHVLDDAGDGAGVGLQFWGFAGPNRLAWDAFVRGLSAERQAPKSLPEPQEDVTEPTTISGVRASPSVTNEIEGEFGELSFFSQRGDRR